MGEIGTARGKVWGENEMEGRKKEENDKSQKRQKKVEPERAKQIKIQYNEKQR
jgi:hypothetical protein